MDGVPLTDGQANRASASSRHEAGTGNAVLLEERLARRAWPVRAAALVASAMLSIVLAASSVYADEPPRTAPGAGSQSHNWTGAYVGGHLGFAF